MRKKRVCIDVGGTFTDCLVMDETGRLQKFKAPTTPSDPTKGLMDAMNKAARYYGVDIGSSSARSRSWCTARRSPPTSC